VFFSNAGDANKLVTKRKTNNADEWALLKKLNFAFFSLATCMGF
jgi:hypothetical protein